MHALAFIHHINITVRMEVLLTLNNGGKVGGGIQGSAVGFPYETGRNLLGICLLCHIHHKGALAFVSQAFIHQHLDHVRNIRLRIAFALPQVKFHIQVGIIFLKVLHGHGHDMLPDGPVGGISLLKLQGRLMGPFLKRLIGL